MKLDELGNALRTLRFKASMSQVALAEKLHCDRTYICKVENGEREPHFLFVADWIIATGQKHYMVSLLIDDEEQQEFADAMDKVASIKKIVA